MPQDIGSIPEYAEKRAAALAEEGLRPAAFDDIAPIFVYFDADLARKAAASAAFRRLRKDGHPLVEDVAKLDEVDPGAARLLYNHAFAALLAEELPDAADWRVVIDQYGGYGCERSDGETAFGSDGVGTFAYYMDAEGVRQRIADIPGSGYRR